MPPLLLQPPIRPSAEPTRSSAVGLPSSVARRIRVLLMSLACALFTTSAAQAVLIDTGDGTGNTTAPTQDPGFDNVGVVNGLSGVYVRNGWVITANHVGEHPILLDGVSYDPIVGSKIRLQNPDASYADLAVYKLKETPPIPDLLITDSAPGVNALITVIGNGRDRGAPTSWMGVDGYQWATTRAIRWGTNRISAINQFDLNTSSFWVIFNDLPGGGGGQHEADVVEGDSGGGAFTGSGSSAELIGILFAHAGFQGQPLSTSLYGNAGLIIDLFAYRSDILAIIDQPDCGNGLDDDGDGVGDYPDDPGCTSLSDLSEHEPSVICDNEIDDDLDGLTDLEDIGCDGPGDSSERGASAECDNGLDDDFDFFSDFPDDPSCLHPTNLYEAPEPGLLSLLGPGLLGLATAARTRRPRGQSSTRSTR